MIPANQIKRNALCPCGSGRKTKHCCMRKIQMFADGIEAGLTPAQIITLGILAKAAPPGPVEAQGEAQ